jgi:hypothetical protein
VRDLLIRAKDLFVVAATVAGVHGAGPGFNFSTVLARVTAPTVSGWFEQIFGRIEQIRRGGCSDKASLLEVAAMTMMHDGEDWSVDADAEDNRLREAPLAAVARSRHGHFPRRQCGLVQRLGGTCPVSISKPERPICLTRVQTH